MMAGFLMNRKLVVTKLSSYPLEIWEWILRAQGICNQALVAAEIESWYKMMCFM